MPASIDGRTIKKPVGLRVELGDDIDNDNGLHHIMTVTILKG
jgi:hypothetical protein